MSTPCILYSRHLDKPIHAVNGCPFLLLGEPSALQLLACLLTYGLLLAPAEHLSAALEYWRKNTDES